MQSNNPVEYVSRLELSTPVAFPVEKGGEVSPQDNEDQAFMIDKSLISFVSDVSEQNRKDILNSTLLAQLAANKLYKEDSQILDWYNEFIKVLSNIGWNIEANELSVYEDSKNLIEMENVIVEILSTAFGGNFTQVILRTLNALKDQNDHNGRIKAFEKNTHTASKGAFQFGLAVEKNNVVALQLGTFLLTTSAAIKRILFFTSSKDKTKLEYYARKATLNEEIYSKVRKAIVDKLGNHTVGYVAAISI